MTYTIQDNKLTIYATLDPEDYPEDVCERTLFFEEAIEDSLCNGLSVVLPEDIGALTDSYILTEYPMLDDGTYPEDAVFWWFPQYETYDEILCLLNDGYITFERADIMN